MTQPTFSQVRQALASTLAAASPGLNAYAEYADQITIPAALILPVTGTFLSYATMDGQLDVRLRAVVCVARGDQAALDPFLAPSGPQSVLAAVAANDTLGGVVSSAGVTEVTGFGPLAVGAVDYLAAHFIVSIGI